MKRRIVPGTDLSASILCLGTADFGSAVDDSRSRAILDRYIDQGGNVIDTAAAYAAWLPGGNHCSEKFLGSWLRERRRATQLIISTKGGHPRFESTHIPRMSRKEVEGDLDSSLRRLGVDSIDIYWLHRDDPHRPVEEFLMVKDLFHHATNERVYERIKSLRKETGLSLSQVMLDYLLGHPFPVFPILGSKKVEDLQQLLEAQETTLAAEQISFLQG